MRRRKRSFTTSWHDEGPAPPSLARQNLGASTKALLGEVSQATGAASADKTSVTRTPAQANTGVAVRQRKHPLDPSAPAPPNAQSQMSPKKKQTPLLLQRRFVAPPASDQKGASSTIAISVAEPKRRMRLATVAHVVATSKAGEKKSTKSPPPRPRPMARQRTEQLIRAAVKELAEVPHTTQRLTIEKRASILLEALHKSGGSKLLHELAEQQTTLVTLSDTTNTAANPGSNGEDTSSANEEDAADGNAALSKFDFGPLTLTVKRAGSTIDNALLARTANSTHAGQDNLSSGCRNGPLPQNRSLQEARRRVVRKLRLVGRMAVVMRNYRQEAEEKLRRRRIEERWDTVRQIAKASLAVLHMRKGVTTSVLSGAWFEDYPLLRRNLVVSPGQRSREAVRQIADELHRTRAFSDFSIPTPARRRIARSAELEVCPAGQAVFHQNDDGGYFYVILTGKVSIQVRDKEPLWSGEESDDGRPRSTGRAGQLAQGRQRRVSLGDAPRKMTQRTGSVNAEQRPSLSRGTDKTSKSNRPRSQRAHQAQREQQRNDQEKETSRRDQRIQGGRAGAADGQTKERNKRANLETRIFGAKRAAELHQHAARHHGKEKKEASFTEVAVLRAGESFGGLGLRTVALGKRKASAIAVEYTELLRIEAVDYREVFMSHEMERIARPVRFLKGMPEFAMLVDDELTQLAYSVRATRFASGTVISRQGQPIDDTLQFGIVTIGRCRRIKLLRHDGSEPTPGDLAQHAQSNQAGETDEDENKGAVSPQQPANISGVTDQLQEYSFQSVGPGSILADRAALVDGQNTVHTHSCTVIADTCVEVYFIPRNSLVFALRNGGKFRELLRKLTPAPTPNKLRDLLEQRNMWIRFQQRFVRETLNETRKGQKIREAIDRSRLAAAHVEGPQLLHNVSHSRVEEDET